MTKILWGQILAVFSVMIFSVWAATQYAASRLGYQPELGEPWFAIMGHSIYPPPAFLWWWFAFEAYAPDIFLRAGGIAVSGAGVAIVIAISMSVWRAREAKRAETYGSARWADRRDLARAGLFEQSGVMLGRFRGQYLRHDGPEHVLCFAPTRSGKGVGLVVPTLLTWPGSAIVHDIKGENWGLSDALGTATEMRAMKNYAGHRLSPWLGHLMVSRSETARQLLTPGEIMQLPPDDEIVMLSGLPPIRAKKTKYYTDPALQGRVVPPPESESSEEGIAHEDDWKSLPKPELWFMDDEELSDGEEADSDGAVRRNPELSDHDAVVPKPEPKSEFAFDDGEPESEDSIVQRRAFTLARQASLNPNDGIDL